MNETETALTWVDREILRSYSQFCEGLSDYIGDGYEIVLHSLENFDRSVIKIINGEHTGRTEGAPITDLALKMLAKIREQNGAPYISYFSKNKKGDPLKSTTIAIYGERGRIIGLVCINFYINTPFSQIISGFFPTEPPHETGDSETYVNNTDELITQAVSQIRMEVLNDSSISSTNKNKEIVARLSDRGIFNLKDGVVKCADLLGISKNTVYMHIRNRNA